MVFVYIFTAIVVLLSLYLLKNRHFFNRDIYRNYGDDKVPWIKAGFSIAFCDAVELFTFVRTIANKYQKSYVLSVFGYTDYCITRASDAEKILNSSTKHLEKGDIYKLLHSFLKTGLLTSDGEKWHTRRRMLTPAFHFNILKEFCEIFKEESDKLIETLRKTNGKKTNVVPISTQFTLNTICESAMGVKLSDLGNNGEVYRNNIYTVGKFLVHRVTKPWLLSDFTYFLFGYQRRFMKILKPVHQFTKDIINKRRIEFMKKHANSDAKGEKILKDENENIYMGSKKKRFAMMDTLLQAQSEGLIDDEGIIEETDTFTFEGHDTSSACMSFTLLLLAHHPEVQEKLYEEIQDVTYGKDDFTVDDFNKMNYMERVLKESLRIYPPVHFISRILTEDLINDGRKYEKGTNVNIFIYDIHRDPEYFPDPEKFDPDRFLPENSIDRSNFAFIAFSAGMRNCIGQRFAMLELKVMLTKIIQKFKIQPVTKREDITFIGDIVLRSKDPIVMKFTPR
ncbi:hypothetical protein PVAND_004555 [Polypedilum vanderplanki]|uniref:Cytochrome P450 n=1 Tax=Polypedilum vanderplanki TaxID=319348 RepID=A0A9J6BXB5_POLVA|nr:hypothetical protein PVAND_004555 [Polypedilum vanderplanki]